MNDEFKRSLGQRIREARLSAGLTQSALAEKADVSTNHISAIERGASDTKTEHFAKIVQALGVSADFLLFGDTSKEDSDKLIRAVKMASRVCDAESLSKYIIAGMDFLEKKER